jgi:prepilin-type N-terminal cleavage/methylation domain-containing protein
MRRSRLSGFTLVELLVVITIIGVLAALIVPAVSSALETARRNTCNNNLSQIGLGAFSYASNKGYYPGYLSPKLNTGAAAYPSWQIVLLNDMGRENAYRSWIDAATGETPYLEMYVCPSDNTAVGLQGPYTSFAVNAGKQGNDDTTSVYEGMCNNLSTNVKSRRVTIDGIPDGADMTILASENVDANKYYDTGMLADPEDLLGIIWLNSSSTAPLAANKSTGKRTAFTSADFQYARPSSNHSGVFNVVFAGRNTKTIDEAIDPTVWQYLMTPNGKKVTPAQTSNTVLSKEF